MESLVKALNSPKESERLYAVQDLRDRGDEAAIVLTKRLAEEEFQVVRDAIVFNLKRINALDAYPRLFDLFLSPDAFLRNAAVDIFGAQRNHAIAYLTAHLDHADREVRKLIMDALYIAGTPEAVLAIRAGIHDAAVNVRITAIEYLGQLGDRDSIPEMLDILEEETEPMLRATILESLTAMADEVDILKAIAVIMPGGDISCVDPVYLPEVIRMTGKAGDEESLCLVLAGVADMENYADDILQAIGRIKTRIPGVFQNRTILDTLYAIIREPRVAESVRYSAVELILSNGVREPDRLNALGKTLMDEPEMIHAGVRLLHASGSADGQAAIAHLLEGTEDKQLRNFCEDLLEEPATD